MNKKQKMYEQIRQHGENLKEYYDLDSTTDPIKLCKAVYRLENKAHKLTTDFCNGLIDSDKMEVEGMKILKSLFKKLNLEGKILSQKLIFLNTDARGYALKINYCPKLEASKIHKDWGRYGIIAPTFTGN